MKHLKRIFEYNDDNLYQFYKDDIDKIAFDRITKTPKKTIYNKWLLDLYKKKKLKLEDIQKAEKYISIFDKPNVYKKLGGVIKIKELDSIQELFKLIQPYYKVEFLDNKDKEEFIKEKCLIKEFKNYYLYVPETHEESIWLGNGTQWCTAADSAESEQTFNSYVKQGKLYILISKTDTKEKYQIHFQSGQFMDITDGDVMLDDDFYDDDIDDIIRYFIDIYGCECYRIFMPDILEEYNIKGDFMLYATESVMSSSYKKTFIKLNIDKNKSNDSHREYIIDCLLKNKIVDLDYIKEDEFYISAEDIFIISVNNNFYYSLNDDIDTISALLDFLFQ
jgi:hypothetical protein